jgi:hypothetical protein
MTPPKAPVSISQTRKWRIALEKDTEKRSITAPTDYPFLFSVDLSACRERIFRIPEMCIQKVGFIWSI